MKLVSIGCDYDKEVGENFPVGVNSMQDTNAFDPDPPQQP
jgi:hypothetical protein